MTPISDHFPTSVAGLPAARAVELVELVDGDVFDLRIAPVAKRLGDATVRMLAYNGSIPGPTLKVREGSEVVVNIENQGDMEDTVHWHGLRIENRYDGTHETQRPLAVGETFSARVRVPDPGIYRYHPHIREDDGQETGLYGNVLVEPGDPSTGRRYTARSCSRLTTSCSRMERSRRSAAPRQRTRQWVALATCFW